MFCSLKPCFAASKEAEDPAGPPPTTINSKWYSLLNLNSFNFLNIILRDWLWLLF